MGYDMRRSFLPIRFKPAWGEAGIEPSLAEVLAEPLVHAVMRCDGVMPGELRAVIDAAQAKLRRGLCLRLAA